MTIPNPHVGECRYHNTPHVGGRCPSCERYGTAVVCVSLDEMDRVIQTLATGGVELVAHSFAVLVFQLPGTERSGRTVVRRETKFREKRKAVADGLQPA